MTEGATSMGSQLNSALMENIKGQTIISEFLQILPWTGVMVGAIFVLNEARKMIKGASRGKVRV